MDILVSRNTITPQDLCSFNRVRCYMQVMSLSDITTADGKRIGATYYNGIKTTKSKWNWHKEQPTSKDFEIWRKLLDSLKGIGTLLLSPLGVWLQLPHHNIEWLFDTKTDYLYKCGGNQCIQYHRASTGSRTNQIFHYKATLEACPIGLSLSTVNIITEDVVILEGIGPHINSIPKTLDIPDPVNAWIQQYCSNHSELGRSWLTKGLKNNSLRAVCDGSHKPHSYKNGITASWIIEEDITRKRVYGQIATAGIKADAYRAELMGILSVVVAIYIHEQKAIKYSKGSLTIGCDNKMAGWNSGKIHARVGVTVKHMDIIKAIRRTQQRLRTKITFTHIYGHQDRNARYNELDRMAQLNVQVDAMAQDHFDICYINNAFKNNAIFPYEGWYVSLGTVKIMDKHKTYIREWIGKHRLREYLYKKGLISWNTFPHIDFDPLRDYLTQQSTSFCLWFTKHWTNFCGIGAKMKLMKLWETDLCPCCNLIPENSTNHLFLCPDQSITELRNKGFNAILKWLQEVNTDPLLFSLIHSQWNQLDLPQDEDFTIEHRKLYETMREIGTQSMWMGLLPANMIDMQQQYYAIQGSRRSGKKWGEQLVGKLLKVTHNLWLHRNSLLHLKADSGISGLALAGLHQAVEKEFDRGTTNMNTWDRHLMDTTVQDILADTEEGIRSWLCEIYIARGEVEQADQEGKRDRRVGGCAFNRISATQRKQFQDWRNVKLT